MCCFSCHKCMLCKSWDDIVDASRATYIHLFSSSPSLSLDTEIIPVS